MNGEFHKKVRGLIQGFVSFVHAACYHSDAGDDERYAGDNRRRRHVDCKNNELHKVDVA